MERSADLKLVSEAWISTVQLIQKLNANLIFSTKVESLHMSHFHIKRNFYRLLIADPINSSKTFIFTFVANWSNIFPRKRFFFAENSSSVYNFFLSDFILMMNLTLRNIFNLICLVKFLIYFGFAFYLNFIFRFDPIFRW